MGPWGVEEVPLRILVVGGVDELGLLGSAARSCPGEHLARRPGGPPIPLHSEHSCTLLVLVWNLLWSSQGERVGPERGVASLTDPAKGLKQLGSIPLSHW